MHDVTLLFKIVKTVKIEQSATYVWPVLKYMIRVIKTDWQLHIQINLKTKKRTVW